VARIEFTGPVDVASDGTFTVSGRVVADTPEPPPIPPAKAPNTLRVSEDVWCALSGVDPTPDTNPAGFPPVGDATMGGRGKDQAVVFTARDAANRWGTAVVVDATGVVVEVVDRQTANPDPGGPAAPKGGCVVSFHGTARDWALASLRRGVRVRFTVEDRPTVPVPVPPPAGGGTDYSVACYHLVYQSTGRVPAVLPASLTELRLAFAFDQPGGLDFADGGFVRTSQAWKDTLSGFTGRGGVVNVSFGGAENRFDVSDPAGSARRVSALLGAVGGSAFDWDIEVGSAFPTAQAVEVTRGVAATLGAAGFRGASMAPNGNNHAAYLDAAVALHKAGLLHWTGHQVYDYAGPTYEALAGRLREALARGLPPAVLGAGFALQSPVRDGLWTLNASVDAARRMRAEFGVRRAFLWTEPGTWQSGAAAQWCDRVAEVLA